MYALEAGRIARSSLARPVADVGDVADVDAEPAQDAGRPHDRPMPLAGPPCVRLQEVGGGDVFKARTARQKQQVRDRSAYRPP